MDSLTYQNLSQYLDNKELRKQIYGNAVVIFQHLLREPRFGRTNSSYIRPRDRFNIAIMSATSGRRYRATLHFIDTDPGSKMPFRALANSTLHDTVHGALAGLLAAMVDHLAAQQANLLTFGTRTHWYEHAVFDQDELERGTRLWRKGKKSDVVT